MATISHYEFTGLYPIGTTYLTSGDGYLHVYNYGPLDLIANMVSVTEPAAPSTGMRLRANEWTLVPADTEDAETRIAFVQLVDDSVSSGIVLCVWTT